ncbi:hypothetical protein M8C21_002613 [Ambrosia artemisiifolia]|uniref:Uncharacterized protein n=1 Tax=Ambrosia artemisiifolia TaxID=4212 RepID=A0AAD5GTH3_AMBAR|nr:hypothetical protein M8C21_002613 [Ambrosia artemisiifolia]
MTTTVPSRSNQRMHNFSLPFLKWGHINTSNRCRRLLSDSIHAAKYKAKTTIEDVVLLETDNNNNNNSSKLVSVADVDVYKPWNLRPRISNHKVISSYSNCTEETEESNKRRKLLISLSKEEIEEDVYALTGSKPARRPKKRNKTIQKQVDNLFPGLYLDGISPDSYRA